VLFDRADRTEKTKKTMNKKPNFLVCKDNDVILP
jgi:hypothetical protein